MRILASIVFGLLPIRCFAATFVMVHGAHVGAWYWEPVASGLEALGHSVVAVELAGHGFRESEAGPHITLEDHVSDVVQAIAATHEKVVLVSHSYGGRPATGAWDRSRDRIAMVVFLEAVAPYGSGSLALPRERQQLARLQMIDPGSVEKGMLPPPSQVVERYSDHKVVAESLAAIYAPLPLVRGPLPPTPGAYVIGSQSSASIFRAYAGKVQAERGWTVYEIDSGHDMVHDAGEVLVRLLNELALNLR